VFTEFYEFYPGKPDMLPQLIQDTGTLPDCWNTCVDTGEVMLTVETRSTRSKICPIASLSTTPSHGRRLAARGLARFFEN